MYPMSLVNKPEMSTHTRYNCLLFKYHVFNGPFGSETELFNVVPDWSQGTQGKSRVNSSCSKVGTL